MMFRTESGCHVEPWDPEQLLSPSELIRLQILKAELHKRGSGILLLRHWQFLHWLIDTGRLTESPPPT